MKLDGSIETNLSAAIASARRLEAHPVHSDTLQFWLDLLAHARAELRNVEAGRVAQLERLITELQLLVSAR